MLAQAFTLYRLSMEKAEDADIDRESGFQQRDWPRIAEGVNRAQKSLEPNSDRAGLRYFLNESQKLPAGQRIAPIDEAIAKAGGVEPFLDQLYANTKIGDLAARKAMMDETTAQLAARNDAMINLAAAITPLSLEIEHQQKELGGAMSRIRPMYMDALRASSGGRLYPDANGTLRITFGKVEGYAPRDGVVYTPQTTIGGILAKNTGSGEFDAPKAELDAIRANKTAGYVDPKLGAVPVDFLSDRRHDRRQLRLADSEREGRAVRPAVRRHVRIARLRLRRRSRHHPLDSRRRGLHALGHGRRRRRAQPASRDERAGALRQRATSGHRPLET